MLSFKYISVGKGITDQNKLGDGHYFVKSIIWGEANGMAAAAFGGDKFYVVYSNRMSWVGSGISLCQFLRIFLLTFESGFH